VTELVDFILKHMVKEVSDRPFPPRAFINRSPPKQPKSDVIEISKESDQEELKSA
jgi:hypothetical protein